MDHVSNLPRPGVLAGTHVSAKAGAATTAGSPTRVLRGTYSLLSLTLMFGAACAAAGIALNLPAPGILLTLAGYFGLLFAVHRFKDSGWALPAVFALTGFMGFTLTPMLTKTLAAAGGAQVLTLALAATGGTFLALSAWVLTTRRDFSFMGGFLFAGMVIALLASLGAMWLQIPALGLAVAALMALLSAGLILHETSRIVHSGETNCVMATVGLYVSIFNLFTSLLSLFGLGGSDDS